MRTSSSIAMLLCLTAAVATTSPACAEQHAFGGLSLPSVRIVTWDEAQPYDPATNSAHHAGLWVPVVSDEGPNFAESAPQSTLPYSNFLGADQLASIVDEASNSGNVAVVSAPGPLAGAGLPGLLLAFGAGLLGLLKWLRNRALAV
jgi:hypothetical protein